MQAAQPAAVRALLRWALRSTSLQRLVLEVGEAAALPTTGLAELFDAQRARPGLTLTPCSDALEALLGDGWDSDSDDDE